MQLVQVNGKSKKTGKEWTGYQVCIGKYKTPVFFPSEIELDYIKARMESQAHDDFKEGIFDD